MAIWALQSRHCLPCLDIILSFSGALLCFRASGANFLRRIFLDVAAFYRHLVTFYRFLVKFSR